MATDDSAMYTGVDGSQDGVFGNEKPEDSVKDLLVEQKRQMAELTPKLQEIVTMIQAERDMILDFVASYVDSTSEPDEVVLRKIAGAGNYRRYLAELQTKYSLALRETRGKE